MRSQMRGELADAMQLYERSLDLHPTAEAYTYLGWTYSLLNRYDEAIEQCELAIATDPSLGNPYNDIGAYLIELGQWEESIEWFEDAISAERYDAPHYAITNLGRVYQHLGKARTALSYYDQALEVDPLYRPALNAKYALIARLN